MTTTGRRQRSRTRQRAFAFVRGATGPLIGLVLLCVFLSFSTDTFLSLRNFLNVMDQITVLGVMAVGMTLVILIGGIDLSVGSVLALSGMVMGYLGDNRQWPFVIAILVALDRLGRVRPDVGPDGDPPEHAGVHRDARDDVDRPRRRQHHHQRRTDRRLSRLVLQPRHHPPLRLPDRDSRRDGRDHRRRLDRPRSSAPSAARSTRIGGSQEVARLAGIPVRQIHDVGLRRSARALAGLAGVILSARLELGAAELRPRLRARHDRGRRHRRREPVGRRRRHRRHGGRRPDHRLPAQRPQSACRCRRSFSRS